MNNEPRPHPFQICHQCANPEELRFKIHNENSHDSTCGICGKAIKVTRTPLQVTSTTKKQKIIDDWKAGFVVLFLLGTLSLFIFGTVGLAIYGVYKLLGR